ncbi:DUF4124 domain-containing protein [Aliikangiella maris]|uniref:DUF4124 domain-containing protein n=2 Tax=Aliikangiella maris TaxID=3162458 RepID=A0ABV2BT37_9GAMM
MKPHLFSSDSLSTVRVLVIWGIVIAGIIISQLALAEDEKKIYRWVDKYGQVHYTDEPRKGATEHKVKEVPAIKMETPDYSVLEQYKPQENPTSNSNSPVMDAYQQLVLTQPENDGVIRNNAATVTLVATIQPALKQQHQLRFFLDGQLIKSDKGSLQVKAENVRYGQHSAQVVIVDETGKQIQASQTNSFHLLNRIKKKSKN